MDLSWQAFGGRFEIAWLEMLVASRADKQLANAVRTVAARFGQKLLESGSSFTSLPVEEFALSQSFEVAVMLGLLVMGIAADQEEYEATRVAVIELLKELFHALSKDPGMLARVLRETAPSRPNGDRTR